MRGFGELEAAIMDRAWSSGRPLLVREIQQTLQPARAYNTVLTVVEILYRKGWLSREKDGRAYRYRATVSRADYTAGLMGGRWPPAPITPRRSAASPRRSARRR